MRISGTRDLGGYVRDRRRVRGWTQTELARAAGVSRRWVSDLEVGKPTVEIGLVFAALEALELSLHIEPAEPGRPAIDLADLLGHFGVEDDG